MRLSISSSRALPRANPIATDSLDRRWLRIWGTAIVLVFAFLAGLELLLRASGFHPTIIDDMGLWAWHRGQIYQGGEKSVVLAGDSRMLAGFSTPSFRERFPGYHIVQLSLVGSSGAPVLHDLAEDENFKGTVIMSFDEYHIVGDDETEGGLAQAHVDYYHDRWSANNRLNHHIWNWLQRRLVILHPNARLLDIVRSLATEQRLPEPSYVRINPDRTRDADYTRIDIKQRRAELQREYAARRPKARSTPEVWLANAMRMDHDVRRIQARGGQVIIVRMPVSGGLRELLERDFPRDRYWDLFAATTSARAIHFQDLQGVAALDLPDYSHLDLRDKPAFTNALLDELVRGSLLADEPAPVGKSSD